MAVTKEWEGGSGRVNFLMVCGKCEKGVESV